MRYRHQTPVPSIVGILFLAGLVLFLLARLVFH
jgi:hypothetical protein